MFELVAPPRHIETAGTAVSAVRPFAAYRGPDRRAAAPPGWHWMAAALDEIDYGVLLLDGAGSVLLANHAARAELDAGHPLQLLGNELRARCARDVKALRDALEAAVKRGLRRLLTLGDEPARASISVVPLTPAAADCRMPTLIILGKRLPCAGLAVEGFARLHHLTSGETRVLVALCHGLRPAAIAQCHGVAMSTVRTQIGSIRQKTGAASLQVLARQIAVLPPLMGVLRSGAAPADATRQPLPAPA